MTRLVLPLLSLLVAVPVSAQVADLPPRDVGAQDPSFIAFRAGLLAAAAARDTAAVLAAFAPDATISFGGDYGPQGIRDLWFSGDYEREPGQDFFSTLVRAVSMGSAEEGGIVSAPYLFLDVPAEYDPFEHVVVVGESVRIRSEPSLSGEVLGSLTYQVVEAPIGTRQPVTADGYTWTPIRLATGQDAWIADDFVWSPIGFRAGFEKRNGRWTVIYFVAGD